MPRERTRHLRVAAQLQRLLNELLLSQVKDPRLAQVRVNDVEVSGDLGVATVYFGNLDVDAAPDDALAAFETARGYFRAQAAQALGLRRAIELRFRHDTSAARAVELSRLIAGAQPPVDKSSDRES
jgi:ribosome-binding factor A